MMAALSGCNLFPSPVEPECSPRIIAYPDADGDGIGDPGEIYVGCFPPDGWVLTPPEDAEILDPTTNDTGDTGVQDSDTPR